jgi:hypothetical protein
MRCVDEKGSRAARGGMRRAARGARLGSLS